MVELKNFFRLSSRAVRRVESRVTGRSKFITRGLGSAAGGTVQNNRLNRGCRIDMKLRVKVEGNGEDRSLRLVP